MESQGERSGQSSDPHLRPLCRAWEPAVVAPVLRESGGEIQNTQNAGMVTKWPCQCPGAEWPQTTEILSFHNSQGQSAESMRQRGLALSTGSGGEGCSLPS